MWQLREDIFTFPRFQLLCTRTAKTCCSQSHQSPSDIRLQIKNTICPLQQCSQYTAEPISSMSMYMSTGSSVLDNSSRSAKRGAQLSRVSCGTRGRTGRRTRRRTALRGGRGTCACRHGAGAGSKRVRAAGGRVQSAALPDSDPLQIFRCERRRLFHEALLLSLLVPGLRSCRRHLFLSLVHGLSSSSDVLIDVDGRFARPLRSLL